MNLRCLRSTPAVVNDMAKTAVLKLANSVKKLESKSMYYKETIERQQRIFWPGCQGRVHCCTAKLEANTRVTVDWVPLYIAFHTPYTVNIFS
jgi:hypothetical protein